MRTAIMILALTAIACEAEQPQVTPTGPTITDYHCTGHGCADRGLLDTASSVVACEGEDPEAKCAAFQQTAPQCWLDLYCDGARPTGCECVVIETRVARPGECS